MHSSHFKLPEREVIPLTQPKEFQFMTERRLRNTFIQEEPAPEVKHNPYTGKPTITEPFHFQMEDRSKIRDIAFGESAEPSAFVSAMERANNFLREKSTISCSNWKPEITVPVEFSFQTDQRYQMRPKEYDDYFFTSNV